MKDKKDSIRTSKRNTHLEALSTSFIEEMQEQIYRDRRRKRDLKDKINAYTQGTQVVISNFR